MTTSIMVIYIYTHTNKRRKWPKGDPRSNLNHPLHHEQTVVEHHFPVLLCRSTVDAAVVIKQNLSLLPAPKPLVAFLKLLFLELQQLIQTLAKHNKFTIIIRLTMHVYKISAKLKQETRMSGPNSIKYQTRNNE